MKCESAYFKKHVYENVFFFPFRGSNSLRSWCPCILNACEFQWVRREVARFSLVFLCPSCVSPALTKVDSGDLAWTGGRLWGPRKKRHVDPLPCKNDEQKGGNCQLQHGALDHSRLFCLLRFLSYLWCFFSSRKGGEACSQSGLDFLYKKNHRKSPQHVHPIPATNRRGKLR